MIVPMAKSLPAGHCHLLIASRTPSPTKIAPDARVSFDPAEGFSDSRRLIAEPNQASTRHHIVPVVMHSAPTPSMKDLIPQSR
jgi:hypothetical protein